MDRRGFLGLLAGLAGATALAPLVKLLPETPVTVTCVIGEYADYCSFSDFALDASIDPQVSSALTTYYNRALLANLTANMSIGSASEMRSIPPASGNTIKFYNYDLGA